MPTNKSKALTLFVIDCTIKTTEFVSISLNSSVGLKLLTGAKITTRGTCSDRNKIYAGERD